MREIVFDTETTGFDPKTGDRIVEIGAIELINHVPTGEAYHQYINPQRDMPSGAFQVHGLSSEFLSDKPLFVDIAEKFLEFLGDAVLIAHNAQFDMSFVNFELRQVGREPIIDAARIVDTLELARKKFPNGPNSLDHLCTRFGIDNTRRTKHGALLDSELLAEVYIELMGGRQTTLALGADAVGVDNGGGTEQIQAGPKARAKPLPPRVTDIERQAHQEFLADFETDMIWDNYAPKSAR
jgi:DNA polymerase-3 subunit epsilon